MINFSFDGKSYAAQEGDTLAAALLRNGIALVGPENELQVAVLIEQSEYGTGWEI